VRSRLSYEPGSTHVSTSANEALSTGAGVCQDFAHVALALLRAAGIPSRYVSGYLHPSADADLGDAVEGQSHAWIETWDDDWYGDDVTNGIVCGERHVVVARARDYADLAPMKGIIQGGAPARLTVGVTLTRVG
jgi:transglutaminase-like putative cysteine protease